MPGHSEKKRKKSFQIFFSFFSIKYPRILPVRTDQIAFHWAIIIANEKVKEKETID